MSPSSTINARLDQNSAVASIVAGFVAIATGSTVILAWYEHWTFLLQIVPGTAPMQYNTALAFIACGAGLILLETRLSPGASWCGGAAALLTLLTLLEYLTGRDFAIDQIFFHPYFEVASAFPGRMAPLTALCFIVYGTALALAGRAQPFPRLCAAAGLLCCIVMVVSTVAAFGYVLHIDSAFGWGAYSKMAVNTALTLIPLGAALLFRCWRLSVKQNLNFLQWIPIAASSTLLLMVAAISTATVSSLKDALHWRIHTYDVLLTAQSFQASVADIHRGMLEVRLTGGQNFLVPYDQILTHARPILDQLVQLTWDNPVQQQRLKSLGELLDQILIRARTVNNSRQVNPSPAAVASSSIEDARLIDRAADLVNLFKQEEQRLLALRILRADAELRSTELLLSVSGTLAALFFIAGSLLVRREIGRRHQLELDLLEANHSVQTLSGLLPICAHCKSIRDDKGYWNRIEQYVQQHSEATFSHGLCEGCARELYPDIADEILLKLQAKKTA